MFEGQVCLATAWCHPSNGTFCQQGDFKAQWDTVNVQYPMSYLPAQSRGATMTMAAKGEKQHHNAVARTRWKGCQHLTQLFSHLSSCFFSLFWLQKPRICKCQCLVCFRFPKAHVQIVFPATFRSRCATSKRV